MTWRNIVARTFLFGLAAAMMISLIYGMVHAEGWLFAFAAVGGTLAFLGALLWSFKNI